MNFPDFAKEVFKGCIDKWGFQAQIDVTIEECSELIKALCKWKRTFVVESTAEEISKRFDGVVDEIADVAIMIEQLSICFSTVDSKIVEKLERQRKRLIG